MSEASRNRVLTDLLALAIDLQSERLKLTDRIAEIDSEMRILSQLADSVGGTLPPEMDVIDG